MLPGFLTGLVFLAPSAARAHGIWSHIHVTGWAVENMEAGELRNFFDDPEVFNAALYGAAFTDSGYMVLGSNSDAGRAYSEYTHWEPFVAEYIEWMHENDPPPWTSADSRKRVAFLMGSASHGLQDEIFDSLFLYQIEHNDNQGQEKADPGSDGFLALDDHLRFYPDPYVPMEVLLDIYQDIGQEIGQELIENAVEFQVSLYVNEESGPAVALALGDQYAEELPWTRLHYLDPEIPGSVFSEIFPTRNYMEAIWDRLHGNPDSGAPIFAFPEHPRRLRSHEHQLTDSWVTFVFGTGVEYGSVSTSWERESGGAIPFEQYNNRWGAGWTRLISLVPQQNLEPGEWYTAKIMEAETIEAQTLEYHLFSFQVECTVENQSECPDLEEIPVAKIHPEEEAQPKQKESSGCSAVGMDKIIGGTVFWGLLIMGMRRKDFYFGNK